MAPTVHLFNRLNSTDITVATTSRKGAMLSYVALGLNSSRSIFIQTPLLSRIFMKTWADKTKNGDNKEEKTDISFSMEGAHDEGSDMNTFLRKIIEPLEERIVATAKDNSCQWFGRQLGDDELRCNFKSHINGRKAQSPEGYFNATMKVQDGQPQCEFYDAAGAIITLQDAITRTAKSGRPGTCILELCYVYITSSKGFGMTVNVAQMQLLDDLPRAVAPKLERFAFITEGNVAATYM